MPRIETVLEMDSHDHGNTYVAWLDSGYTYATYDNYDGLTIIKPAMLTAGLDKATTVTETEISNTPFSTWEFPRKVLRVHINGHCDLFAMPVRKDIILTAWGDKSLEHGADTPENLRETITRNTVTQEIPGDTPFKRNSSSELP